MPEGYQDSGVMFASSSHRVIFINETLQKMLKYPETELSIMIGKQVFEILGITEETYLNIATEIGMQGKIDKQSLEVSTQSGKALSVLIQGEANIDVSGGFAGIDYMFYATEVIEEQAEPIEADVDELVPNTVIQDAIRDYFMSQIEGLDKLMTVWGGEKFSLYLNNVVNSTAQQHGWAVTMESSKITVDPTMTQTEVYHGLLYKAAAYVKEALGDAIVHKQVEQINDKTDPNTFEHIERDWLKHL